MKMAAIKKLKAITCREYKSLALIEAAAHRHAPRAED